MNLYDIWIPEPGRCCLVDNMETAYINNCVNQISKAAAN